MKHFLCLILLFVIFGFCHSTVTEGKEKLDHKNAIKHENRRDHLDFLTIPSTPPPKNLEMTVHLCTTYVYCLHFIMEISISCIHRNIIEHTM